MEDNKQLNTINFNEDTINIREEVEKYAFHWKWFIISIIIALLVVKIYLRYTPNQYAATTTILIGDKGSNELSAFKELGLIGGSNNSLENEMVLFKSRSLFERVVKDLGINVQFFKKGRVYDSEIFVQNAPYKINFLIEDSKLFSLSASFSIIPKSDTNFMLVEGVKRNEYTFGKKIETNFG